MTNKKTSQTRATISTFDDFAKTSDYSLLDTLVPDPDSTQDGFDFRPRQVFSGHFVPVQPTAIAEPMYVTHSHTFFNELGLSPELAHDEAFIKVFSGDL